MSYSQSQWNQMVREENEREEAIERAVEESKAATAARDYDKTMQFVSMAGEDWIFRTEPALEAIWFSVATNSATMCLHLTTEQASELADRLNQAATAVERKL